MVRSNCLSGLPIDHGRVSEPVRDGAVVHSVEAAALGLFVGPLRLVGLNRSRGKGLRRAVVGS